jgi:hypothetical protein
MLTTTHACKIKLIAIAAQSTIEEQNMDEKERFFSLELKSKANLKNVTMTNGGHENVLIEGTIGRLRHATFVDGVVLEILCEKGVLRINLAEEDIKKSNTERVTTQNGSSKGGLTE